MPARNGFAKKVRAFAHKLAHHKKCRSRSITIQKIKKFWRNGWIRPVIESDCELMPRLCAVNRLAKQLRLRVTRAICRHAGDSRQGRRGRDVPRIHDEDSRTTNESRLMVDHYGLRKECRSVPNCWHFLYKWLRSRPSALETLVM